MPEFPKTTRQLPPGYHQVWTLDMRLPRNLLIGNLAGLALLIVSAPLTFFITVRIRQAVRLPLTSDSVSAIGSILMVILAAALMLLLHEGFHGLCFWVFTGQKPRFALKVFYAYAAAPDWYISKIPYLITALAPFAGISLLGFIGMALAPAVLVFPLALIIILNASGAAGDLWAAGALLRRPSSVLVQDHGDAISFYEPEPAAAFLDDAS